jgi:hypothetical protein
MEVLRRAIDETTSLRAQLQAAETQLQEQAWEMEVAVGCGWHRGPASLGRHVPRAGSGCIANRPLCFVASLFSECACIQSSLVSVPRRSAFEWLSADWRLLSARSGIGLMSLLARDWEWWDGVGDDN